NAVLLAQLVDLLLVEPGGGDIRRRQATSTAADVRADSRQGVKPQLAEPADRSAVNRRGRPGPGGIQLWAGVGVKGAGVQFNAVSQRYWNRGRSRGHRQTGPADLPQVVGELG